MLRRFVSSCATGIRGRFYDVPHRFTRAMQDEAFD